MGCFVSRAATHARTTATWDSRVSLVIVLLYTHTALIVVLFVSLTDRLYSFILMLVGVVAFIPVVGLAGFHCGLVCMGRTTNEQV